MKRLIVTLMTLGVFVGYATTAFAFFLNFENGVEGQQVTDIAGVSFINFNGYPAIYSDIRTGLYNATSDNLGTSYGGGLYHLNGNFAIWAGANADARGLKVDFTNNDGTWFKTGYSSSTTFDLEAYLTDGSVAMITGQGNTGGPMGYLSYTAPIGKFIDFVVLHDTGNFWIVDDMSGDTSGISDYAVPEPASILLLAAGIASIFGFRKLRSN